MREELFKQLVASVREGGAILRGETAPSRKFVVDKTDVMREVRENGVLTMVCGHTLGFSVSRAKARIAHWRNFVYNSVRKNDGGDT